MNSEVNTAEPQAYLAAEAEEIRTLYQYLSSANLRLVVRIGNKPFWGEPTLQSGNGALKPDAKDYRTIETWPDRGQPRQTYVITIPPLLSAGQKTEADWRPRTPIHKFAAEHFPTFFEQLKFKRENAVQAHSLLHDNWRKYGPGHLPGEKSEDAGLEQLDPAPNIPAAKQTDKDKSPAIILAFHWLEMGGAEKFAFDTVRLAVEAGLRVFVVADKQAHQSQRKLVDAFPQVRFLRTDRYLRPKDWPVFLQRLIEAENVQILHNHHCTLAYDALAHLRQTCPQLKVIDTTHIVEYANGGFPRMSGTWTDYIDYHHVISAQLSDFYAGKFQRRDNVLLGRLLEKGGTHAAFRFEGSEPVRLIFVGRLTHQKRPFLLVPILQHLLRSGIKLHLDVVGDGPYREQFERLVRNKRLSNVVTMHAPGAPVAKLMQKSDILLLPSANEGLALVCYEAIENGVIPIASNVGAQSELLPAACLTAMEPAQCVKDSVAIVKRLCKDRQFRDKAKQDLSVHYARICAEPTGAQVISKLYKSIAGA